MFEKIKNYPKQELLDQLRDVRVIGLLIFTVIVLLISWSGIKVIQSNYQLQKQISQLKQENQVEDLRNSNTALQNDYYKTDQYLEIAARQNFGLAAPGEKELIVPKEVALAKAPEIKTAATPEAEQAQASQPFFMRNLEAWRNFFLNRSADEPLTNQPTNP